MQKIKQYIRTRSRMKLISDGLFVAAIVISLYTLISTQLVRASLPEGVCPVNMNIRLFYLSLALLIVSFFVSFFEHRFKA